MKTSGTQQKMWIRIHRATHTLFFTMAPNTYNGEKTASSTNVAGKSGNLHAEN
jgi:hypothetical protein